MVASLLPLDNPKGSKKPNGAVTPTALSTHAFSDEDERTGL